jgi:uncharacterized protein (TIGR03067 family)
MAYSPLRPLWLLVVLSIAAVLLAPALSAIADETNKTSTELDGPWKIISIELAGEARPLEEDVRWLIKDGKVFFGGEPLAALTNYPSSPPKGIDLAFHEPKKEYEGIYVVEKDLLRICLNLNTTGAKERPADFSTKDKSNWRVLTLERVSPTDDGPPPAKGFIGMALAIENGQDVVVSDVIDNSPAEKAGLRAGDVLLKIGDHTVRDLNSTVEAVRRESPGSNLTIRVRRDGNEKEIAVKIGIFPFQFLGLLD